MDRQLIERAKYPAYAAALICPFDPRPFGTDPVVREDPDARHPAPRATGTGTRHRFGGANVLRPSSTEQKVEAGSRVSPLASAADHAPKQDGQASPDLPSAVVGTAVSRYTDSKQIPPLIRARLETAFGQNFGAVRIHQDNQPSTLGAIAFTQRNQIHFAPGRYQPWSPSGRKLLAHELGHVVQQRAGRAVAPRGSTIPVVTDSALEAEADAQAARAGGGMSNPTPLGSPAIVHAQSTPSGVENAAVRWAVGDRRRSRGRPHPMQRFGRNSKGRFLGAADLVSIQGRHRTDGQTGASPRATGRIRLSVGSPRRQDRAGSSAQCPAPDSGGVRYHDSRLDPGGRAHRSYSNPHRSEASSERLHLRSRRP
jgi:hypothetical protein